FLRMANMLRVGGLAERGLFGLGIIVRFADERSRAGSDRGSDEGPFLLAPHHAPNDGPRNGSGSGSDQGAGLSLGGAAGERERADPNQSPADPPLTMQIHCIPLHESFREQIRFGEPL